VGSKRAYHAMH